jgi:hypothetical protein
MRSLHVSALLILTSSLCYAQVSIPTRWTVGGGFTLAQPRDSFAQNIGNGYGGGGEVIYHLVRSGILSLRTDVSAVSYGREKTRAPFSAYVPRVQLDVRTTNSIVALGWGPEVARPSGRFRPYAHAGYSRLFFRTTSSVQATDETVASSTNHKDGTGAWVYGGGLRVKLGNEDLPLLLDTGVSYYKGGVASYLREGGIQDNPDGTITMSPLTSRTPFVVYRVGVKFRIPFTSRGPCSWFIC